MGSVPVNGEREGKLHKLGGNLDFWWRVARAVIGILGIVWLAWTQLLGAGVKAAFQDFVGVTDLMNRIDLVERLMPPPRVVEWNTGAIRQLGSCAPDKCLYLLSGARTPYGEDCGRPIEVTPFLRTSTGQNIQIEFDGFEPVELTRELTTFTVPLVIPPFIAAGDHELRVRLLYPTCPGRGEPIPRWTPFFPLRVGKD